MLAEVGTTVSLRPRPVASSVEELLAGASRREPFGHTDGKSQSPFERVVIGGERYVVKYLHVDHDWIARSLGDLTCYPLTVWRSGILGALPPCIDSAVVGAAAGLERHGWGAALLMRDLGDRLVPAGDDRVGLEQHRAFVNHMAALHAHFWGFNDTVGLLPAAHRWLMFGPHMIDAELARDDPPVVPGIAAQGWERFAQRAPADVAATVKELLHDIGPLVGALWQTPLTLVHGDWKMGNLGTHGDGRTILLDWQAPGEAPGACDLSWYLSLNAARLPESKEEAIAAYRSALTENGVVTSGWFDVQMSLCLLGAMVQFGWEKALGADEELGWWVDRAREGARQL